MEDTEINRIEASNEQNNVAKMFSSRTLMGKFISFVIRMATTQNPLSTDVVKTNTKLLKTMWITSSFELVELNISIFFSEPIVEHK